MTQEQIHTCIPIRLAQTARRKHDISRIQQTTKNIHERNNYNKNILRAVI